MNMEFFATLPSEIIIDILSRLSVRSVTNCKCVCKSWLGLVETREFAKSHLSNSVPGSALAVLSTFGRLISWCQIVEFTDIKHLIDVLDNERHSLHFNAIIKLQFPYTSAHIMIWASADGLLLLCNKSKISRTLYVCNPITREYINLYSHHFDNWFSRIITYGFGTSKITGKYKAVMFHHTSSRVSKSECKVYTIGTGSWRSIASDTLLAYECSSNTNGAFVNGNLHWMARDDIEGKPWISCFDLETELFTIFYVPLPASGSTISHKRLCALEGCLCLCFDTSKDKTEIWLMNEYGVEKSWTKKFVIAKSWIGLCGKFLLKFSKMVIYFFRV